MSEQQERSSPVRGGAGRWRRAGVQVAPVLIALAGVLASLGGWRLLAQDQRESALAALDVAASGAAHASRVQVEKHIEALEGLADFWARLADRAPGDALASAALFARIWDEDARVFLEGHPAFEWVAWLRPGTDRPPAVAVRPGGRAPDVALLQRLARRHAPTHLAGPVDDGRRFRVVLALDGPAAGVAIAEGRIEELLDPTWSKIVPGYALHLTWEGREVLRRGDPPADVPAWWSTTRRVDLPLDGTWDVTVQPDRHLAAVSGSQLPEVFFAGGAALSLALALLAHEWHRAQATTAQLDAANRELAQKVREAELEDQELRRLTQQLESRVAERTAELAEAVKDLESFNYSVSHDLRSPIGAVLNFAALVEEDHGEDLGPEGREMLTRIRSSAESALDLLEGLLALSRTGRAALQRRTVDMNALAEEAFVECTAAEGGARVDFRPAKLPPAWADPSLMLNVFSNLLSNALKYSRDREQPVIEVGGREGDGENVYWVRDNGVGFDMRHASKLFRIFERLHPLDEFEGTGVGLAMVSRIVRRHGGRVWATGEPDAGATFTFTLPRDGRPS